MELLRKDKLVKLKKKNQGNKKLILAIDKLILDIEKSNWKNSVDIKLTRPDADKVHSDGFYFFNLSIHRTMILIVFDEEEAIIIWAGSHKEYNNLFKGNKRTIRKWLRNQKLI